MLEHISLTALSLLHQMCPLKNTVGAGAHREAHQLVAHHGAPLLTERADP